MAKYDEKILLKAAVTLEVRAQQIVFMTAAKYGVFMLLFAIVGGVLLRAGPVHQFPAEWVAGVLAGIALIVGIVVGRERAFWLRLQSQKLFALVEIERNTRKPISVTE